MGLDSILFIFLSLGLYIESMVNKTIYATSFLLRNPKLFCISSFFSHLRFKLCMVSITRSSRIVKDIKTLVDNLRSFLVASIRENTAKSLKPKI